jgi:hypothetical protein
MFQRHRADVGLVTWTFTMYFNLDTSHSSTVVLAALRTAIQTASARCMTNHQHDTMSLHSLPQRLSLILNKFNATQLKSGMEYYAPFTI